MTFFPERTTERLRQARWRAAFAAARLAGGVSRATPAPLATIRAENDTTTPVDEYWAGHTVNADDFPTRRASLLHLEWRFDEYPLFREFSGLWGQHDGEVLLDYGCGPGNDVTGFAVHTGARRIIGIDVSDRALRLAARRLALHQVDPSRVELIRSSDARTDIPLETASIDYIQSQGVLHHVSDPLPILAELNRVLRPGGRGCVMVYNRDSIWFHLFTAYERMVLQGAFEGLDVDEAFARNTDGEDCPISRCYRSLEWAAICERAGFEVEYLGGYLSRVELALVRGSLTRAMVDDRLAEEHRGFLRGLTYDAQGFPVYDRFHAGIGGVYRLRKPS